MSTLAAPGAALDPVRRALATSPAKVGVILDFDGTLAAIQEDPATVLPIAGAAGALERLARRAGLVAIVSARPVAFLRPLFPPPIRLYGLYGLETAGPDGSTVTDPAALPWRVPVQELAVRAVAELPAGVRVEPKGLSLALHYREHPEHEDSVWAWAEAEASRTGLRLQAGRLVAELRPPVGGDKGDAVRELLAGLDCAVYAGDDRSDLAAFEALNAYPRLVSLRIAVRNTESGQDLAAAADLTVANPAELVALLDGL